MEAPAIVVTRQDIVIEARRWVGVPWRHQGRSQSGIDCAGLVVMVAHDLGLSEFDTTNYGRLPEGDRLLQICQDNLVQQPKTPLMPGQVVAMRFDGNTQHLGIIGTYPVEGEVSLIHSYANARKCTEHRLDTVWTNRIVEVFDFPGVTI